jgi:hypothetical protein
VELLEAIYRDPWVAPVVGSGTDRRGAVGYEVRKERRRRSDGLCAPFREHGYSQYKCYLVVKRLLDATSMSDRRRRAEEGCEVDFVIT